MDRLSTEKAKGTADIIKLIDEWKKSESHVEFVYGDECRDMTISHRNKDGTLRDPTPEEVRKYAWFRRDHPGPNGEPTLDSVAKERAKITGEKYPDGAAAWHTAGANSDALTATDITLLQQNRDAILERANRITTLESNWDRASNARSAQYEIVKNLRDTQGQPYYISDDDRKKIEGAVATTNANLEVARTNFNTSLGLMTNLTPTVVGAGAPPRVISITGVVTVTGTGPEGNAVTTQYNLATENGQQVLRIRNADGTDGRSLNADEIRQLQPAALTAAHQTIAVTSMNKDGGAVANTASLQISMSDMQGHVTIPTGLPVAAAKAGAHVGA